MNKPFKIQTMHFWSNSKGGATLFSPLKETVESLSDEEKAEWNQLTYVGDQVAHPLIYPHPITGESTMVFHCGESFCRTFAKNFDPKKGTAEELYDHQRMRKIIGEIGEKLEDPSRCFSLEWEEGDFGIIDNLAIAHFASADT